MLQKIGFGQAIDTLSIDENRARVGPKQSKNELEHDGFPGAAQAHLGLLRPDAGAILVNGQRIDRLTEADLLRIRGDIGMLFQENALFDSLTVAENVGYRLYEETDTPEKQVRSRIEEILGFIGLPTTSTTCRRICPVGSGVACDRDATPLPTGQIRRHVVDVVGEPDEPEDLFNAAAHLFLRRVRFLVQSVALHSQRRSANRIRHSPETACRCPRGCAEDRLRSSDRYAVH